MAKQKKGKREIEAADYAILALPAQGRKLCSRVLQEEAESELRDKLDGKGTKGKKTRKLLQTENHVTSSSKGHKKSNKHERSAENSLGHDIESGALSRSPGDNELLISFVRRAKGRKKENYASSPSDDEVLSSWIIRQKRMNQEQRDYLRSPSDSDVLISMVRRQNRRKLEKIDNSDKSEGTKISNCNLSEKDLISQLPITSCCEKDSKGNGNASPVGLSGDRSEVEKKSEEHDLAESIEICQDVQATYTCSSTTINCSNAEPDEKPFSEVDNMDISLVEARHNHAVITNSKNPEILHRYTYRRRGKYVPPVFAQPTPDTMSLLQGPSGMENPSLVESVGPVQPICSEDLNEKESKAADDKILSSKELRASRDKNSGDDDMNLLSHKGSLTISLEKKLLVLDINGLLADIVSYQPWGYTADTIINGRSVFKRPFCNDFLEFCFARFNVGVWSSRTSKNVEPILDFLMGNAKDKLLFYWDQSHCTNSGYKTIEGKPLYVKKLKKLWGKQEYGLPWDFGEYNESNTLLLDDSPYKSVCNPPFTAVFPPSYKYSNEEDNSLGPGGELRMYLESLAVAENVQKYVQQNLFGQEPITENHPKWSFYRKVIQACSSSPTSPVYAHKYRPWR